MTDLLLLLLLLLLPFLVAAAGFPILPEGIDLCHMPFGWLLLLMLLLMLILRLPCMKVMMLISFDRAFTVARIILEEGSWVVCNSI